MDEGSLQFHIEENDYFGTLATVLDLVSQDLGKKGHRRNAETLLRQRDRLLYLQQEYRIEKIECRERDSQPAHKVRPSVLLIGDDGSAPSRVYNGYFPFARDSGTTRRSAVSCDEKTIFL